ncbi:MAG: histidinol-phosphatase, partial [Alistipes sp.]|nr:histidinol-phosphatase [Alistipes sp.]
NMKRLFISLLALVPLCATAQYNPETLRTPVAQPSQRINIVLPQVNGYNIYKTDLHTHSVYSDGDVTPAFRVREAFYDGLDAIAITEHLEYRRHEGNMLKFLKGYTGGKVVKAKNYDLINRQCPKDGIMSDQNYPVEEAVRESKKFGVLVIPGAEITREPVEIGHFNALFTKDNNAIYDPDPLQSIRNAREQGAIIQHNHPGWRRTTCAKTEFEVQAYNEGLIDGIEVANGGSLYTTVIDRAFNENLFVASNSDIHVGTAETYALKGQLRNMTLIFAKECTLESLYEALQAKRTLAYSGGYITGNEQLLKDLFLASVSYKVISKNNRGCSIVLTNNCSFAYSFKTSENALPITLHPMKSITISTDKKGVLNLTMTNMFCGTNKHPQISLEVK